MILWGGALALAGTCAFTVGGTPTQRLDCVSGGAWQVACELPTERSGELRIRLTAEGTDLRAEARVPLAASDRQVIPLLGPGGRAGAFLVDRAAAGLLPGQAVGPRQLCPVVQPGVTPGAARAEVPVTVTVTEHTRTGFAEQELEGGVTTRVPTYGAGRTVSSGTALVVRHPVTQVAVLTGVNPLSRDEPVQGQLSLNGADGTWRTLTWTGAVRDVEVESGDLRLLVIDFVAPMVAVTLGGDPIAALRADLERWLAAEPSSRLGLVAWDRSELETPQAVTWSTRGAAFERGRISVSTHGERLRVVVAHRATPLDDKATSAIHEAARKGL